MTVPKSMSARRLRIVEILQSHPVRSQAELRDHLAADGIEVTQATLSRDLDDLRAVKVPDADGELVYAVPGEGGDSTARPPDLDAARGSKLTRIGRELIISVDSSANLVVLRTPPGAAQYLASAIDHTVLVGIIRHGGRGRHRAAGDPRAGRWRAGRRHDPGHGQRTSPIMTGDRRQPAANSRQRQEEENSA